MGELLERAVKRDNLRQAWNEVAENQGMPGVDEISIRRWERTWEEQLTELSRAVRRNTYKPSRLRVRRIPKPSGGWRTLRIPTVSDRVLQRAVLQVLHPIFEPRFLDCSFGYRPGRGVRDAVRRIIELRESGLVWVLDADIAAFFDSVDHPLLVGLLRERVEDSALLSLIERWLGAGAVAPGRGIAMGSPISPLLANVYLHPLDRALWHSGRQMVRYADDFIVLVRSRADAEAVYSKVEAELAALRLHYEPTKTRIAGFQNGFDFLGVSFLRDTCSFVHKGDLVELRRHEAEEKLAQYDLDYE